ncbi:MAG: hypothetical protein J6S57_01615 [Alphaproteobacteria bacterium]|nr:hypothetical protein [Alphaproteobacteria bacterium]
MLKKLFVTLLCFITSAGFGAVNIMGGEKVDMSDALVHSAEEMFEATKIVCSGISDEISKISKVSKANTAVTAVGTVAAGGALAAGIAKSKEEKEIERIIDEICKNGGCTAEGVRSMSLERFYSVVISPMAEIAELQRRIERSKKLGNWRTGLMAGTIGTNLASAIISGVNRDQSDLIQHIEACNEMVKSIKSVSGQLKAAGVDPMDNPIVKKIDNIKTWCAQINTSDVEKIEKRMKGVMGTSIAGTVVGVVGTATSASANSDEYMDIKNKMALSDSDKSKEKHLNTTANIMAGANVGTGLVETGLNISLIKLTKDLMGNAQRCEEVLQ